MTSKCFNCDADAKWLTPLGYKICTGCKPHVVQGRKSSREDYNNSLQRIHDIWFEE